MDIAIDKRGDPVVVPCVVVVVVGEELTGSSAEGNNRAGDVDDVDAVGDAGEEVEEKGDRRDM